MSVNRETVWPFSTTGIIESVITTEQADGSWNVAALGVHTDGSTYSAKTWGETRTRVNLSRTNYGYVQTITDSMDYARAALDRWTVDDPILPSAAAWVSVETAKTETGSTNGTTWVKWILHPEHSEIKERHVPTPTRGFPAVVEMTIAASRLGVPSYDQDLLVERLDYFNDVVKTCGTQQDREAANWILSTIDEQIIENHGEPDSVGSDSR